MTIEYCSLSGASSNALGLEDCKIRALRTNPCSAGDQQVAAVIGKVDEEVAGSEVVFPLRIKFGDREVEALAGSGLNVKEKFRKSGLGLELPDLRWQAARSKIGIGAGLSQMALPVHQFADYDVFLMPRQIMLWKSRSVVEMKLHGVVQKAVSATVDLAIWMYAHGVGALAAWKLRGVSFREVSADDSNTLDQIAGLVAANPHRCAEVHDVGWLKWHMTESFSGGASARVFAMEKDGVLCGFYMTKSRFYKQASHRGFKNVWLGSIIEWECSPEAGGLRNWMLLRAALQLRREGMDAVEIANDDAGLQKFLARIGWRTVGEGNFVIKCGEGSGFENADWIHQQTNWRLRPAMGDNGIT